MTRGASVPVTRAQIVERARSQLGRGIRYWLGAGGVDPTAATCGTPGKVLTSSLFCDCSGFDAYALGLDRQQPTFPIYGGWISTDSMVGEARTSAQWFAIVAPGEVALPGDAVVFPGVDLDRDGKRDRIGHTGIVSEVPDGWRVGDEFGALRVVHCHGPALRGGVDETSGEAWEDRDRYRSRRDPRWASVILRYLRAG